MTPDVTVLSLELLVPRIDDALSVFVDTLGFELAHRGPSPDVSAEVAVLDAGSIAITLIQPVDGAGPMIPDVTARLSQLVIGVEGGSLETVMAARGGGRTPRRGGGRHDVVRPTRRDGRRGRLSDGARHAVGGRRPDDCPVEDGTDPDVTLLLPPLVPVEQELVEENARAHAELFEALDASDALTTQLFKIGAAPVPGRSSGDDETDLVDRSTPPRSWPVDDCCRRPSPTVWPA